MTIRKQILANDCFYHIFSRSIAKFVVFNDDAEYRRFLKLINLYKYLDFEYRMSDFIDLEPERQAAIVGALEAQNDLLVEIVAYCIMPTHFHLLLKQVNDGGIAKFVGRVLNSFSRYFNERHKRNGPLWSGRFKSVLIETDDQLLHLSRYIHLNPVSANLIKYPEDWTYSSYKEFISTEDSIDQYKHQSIIDLSPKRYKRFVDDGKSYQKNLSLIKKLIIDDYTG